MAIENKMHHKLVRDKVPEWIESQGGVATTEIISDATEYEAALREKLLEEAREVAEADRDHLLEEMGDVMSVLDALRTFHGITADELTAQQKKKDLERGTFQGRIKLISTKEQNG